MLTLYQFEGCPYCQMVRQKLSDMEMTYISVCVPRDRSQRETVVRVSGQPSVPVLVDGDVVLSDEQDIIAYLERTYVAGGARA
ncbi:MAG: glutathione S-transferase N-terminal domain-containing protein [Thermaerobacter sp.]|nr:glutathione S-transferase N-terminal domain-containing protein [Thermaerobacter sp.]